MDFQRAEPIPSLRPRLWPFGGRGRGTRRSIPTWAKCLVGLACGLTPVLVGAAMFVVWYGLANFSLQVRPDLELFCYGPAAATVVVTALCLIPRSTVSRWVRAAALVPLLHILLMVLVWWLWREFAPQIAYTRDRLPLVVSLPAPTIGLIAGALVFVGALVPSSRRRRGQVPLWLRGAVVFSLVLFLVLGLWLPIAAAGWSQLFEPIADFVNLGRTIYDPAAGPNAFTAVVIIPAAFIALLVTIGMVVPASPGTSEPSGRIVPSNPEGDPEGDTEGDTDDDIETLDLVPGSLQRWSAVVRNPDWIAPVVVIVLFVAILCRMGTRFAGYLAYANLIHVLLAAALFSLLCILTLAVAHWRALRASAGDADRAMPWVQRGVVEAGPGEPQVVGWLESLGWLGGQRFCLRPFALRTERGRVAVPRGARLVAPLPAGAVSAEAGDATPVVRAGDRVTASGYVEGPQRGPFRGSELPIPGSDGVVVSTPRNPDQSIARDVLVVVWRPCALYLLAATLVAIPGVFALIRF